MNFKLMGMLNLPIKLATDSSNEGPSIIARFPLNGLGLSKMMIFLWI